MEKDLKIRIFSINEFNQIEVKSSIAFQSILNLGNKLKAIEQTMDLY